MKIKKGFTLIELLAVIVILAVLSFIATPIVLNLIKDSQNETERISVEMYGKALENAIYTYQLSNTDPLMGKYITKDGKNLILSGENEPKLFVDYEGNIVCDEIELYDDDSVYIGKCKVNGKEVEYSYGKQYKYICRQVQDKTTPNTFPYVGYNTGDAYDCEVKEGTIYRFYILSVDGDYINLIAQQNISPEGQLTPNQTTTSKWYSDHINGYGPQTAYEYLSKATKDWTNIPVIENFSYLDEGNQKNSLYGYQGIETKLDVESGNYITTIIPYSSDFGQPKTYENMRVRLPYYSEIENNVVKNGSLYPLWLVNYLYPSDNYPIESGKVNSTGNNYGYWLLSSAAGRTNRTYCVLFKGSLSSENGGNVRYGLRPVIIIHKSNIF